jgi:hypothetical protein
MCVKRNRHAGRHGGGAATDFVRNGFEIEASLHEMMSIDPKEKRMVVGARLVPPVLRVASERPEDQDPHPVKTTEASKRPGPWHPDHGPGHFNIVIFPFNTVIFSFYDYVDRCALRNRTSRTRKTIRTVETSRQKRSEKGNPRLWKPHTV